MIVSFGWTSDALVIGAKTRTRRDWAQVTASRIGLRLMNFPECFPTFDAWNTSPRNVSGHPHKIATCRLMVRPYLEPGRDCPDEDYHREGFGWLQAHGYRLGSGRDARTPNELWRYWRQSDEQMYVVCFEVAELTAAGKLRKSILEAKGWGLR